ncbi:MAG: hypothetical protein QOH76_810 [Thermoleophilaceae bacterium]|jgi:hypothetical protein|nr:hypothetical protein [Thermoleophilaceae bacterium]
MREWVRRFWGASNPEAVSIVRQGDDPLLLCMESGSPAV